MEESPHADKPSGHARRSRRTDPERRDRIIDTCLEVIADVGVAGASHRKIAEAADVPLGSMSYHFDGMDELLSEAFTRFADAVASRFEQKMAAATSRESARDAVVVIIMEEVFGPPDDLVITNELYTLSARKPQFRAITTRWMARSRAALELHFDPETARGLDALIEGITLHQVLSTDDTDREDVIRLVDRMIGDVPRT